MILKQLANEGNAATVKVKVGTSEYLQHECLIQMAVFWVSVPCSLVEVYRRFTGTCCPHHQGDDRHISCILLSKP
jgi:hypothetical protein